MQKLYTVKHVASLLNISEYTVRKWIKEDKIQNTFKFVHKTIRIPESSIQQLVGNRS